MTTKQVNSLHILSPNLNRKGREHYGLKCLKCANMPKVERIEAKERYTIFVVRSEEQLEIFRALRKS